MSGIQMALMGGSPFFGTVTLDNRNPTEIVTDPLDAAAVYTLNVDGTVDSTGEFGIPNWLSIPANAALFEARVTVIGGALSSGPAAGTWWNLGSVRSWAVQRLTIGTNTCSLTVEIRLASTGIVQASATVNFTATVEL